MDRRKLFVHGTLLFFLIVIAAECAGRVVYRLALDRPARLSLERLAGDGDPSAYSVANYVPHHSLVFALNPEARTPWPINRAGFRGPDIPREKPAGTYRVACVGGSTTFGIGQRDDADTYPRILENSLNTFFQGRYQVINGGTQGWTSAENLVNFHFRLMDFAPDMVIVYDGINDLFPMGAPDEGGPDYSNFRRIYEPPLGPARAWLLRHSHLLRTLYYFSYRVRHRGVPWDINSLAAKPLPEDRLERLNAATGKYFERNLEALVALAGARGVRPVLVTMGHGPYHPALARTNEIVRRVAARTGAVLVDFERAAAPDNFAEDQVHLLTEGNRQLVSVLCQKFAEAKILRPKRSQ